MRLPPDELAGITDLFGAVRPPALEQGVRELAFRRGTDFDPAAYEESVERALDGYHLVSVDLAATDGSVLTAGPTAFPRLPDGAEDLPHILDIERREVDRETVGREVEQRLRGEAARAVADGDWERATTLLDVTYDLETWAPVEIEQARKHLDAALDGE
ncbi:MAG: hypothetical protein ABEJ35_00745 [Halobacteriaceae archaeon]